MSTLLSRLYNFVTDKANSVKITAARVDGELNQLIVAVNRKMLCAASAPADPINGQTWVDTANNLVKCYLNNAWVIIANYIYIQSSEPEGMAEGYLWYDTTNNLFKAYNGATWDTALIYPADTAAGDLLYLSAANTLARLAKGTTAQCLKGGDTPSWTTIPTKATLGIDFGSASVGANTYKDISFNFTFASAPIVVCTFATAGDVSSWGSELWVSNVSTTGVRITQGADITKTINWIAIGTPA
ncbi:MAG TPA: hypothetical protein PKM71_04360 [Candidatus Cloacimonas sp.]|nr:hypothetical protein [Candidatus Cloacimonas sp.]